MWLNKPVRFRGRTLRGRAWAMWLATFLWCLAAASWRYGHPIAAVWFTAAAIVAAAFIGLEWK